MSQRAHVISNGCFATLLTARGGGYSALDGFALTRWQPDPADDAQGFVLYLRDPAAGGWWSAAGPPLGAETEADDAGFEPGRAWFRRRRGEIEVDTEVRVAPERDAEVRRYRLTNLSGSERRLELTSYAELVLNTPAADAAHPAFSKLFVQTAYLPEQHALIAWRRLRSPDDRPLCAAHRLLVAGAEEHEPEFETDRMRFLGRGRGPADAAALDGGPLGRTVGNVLDPVFALRRFVVVPAGGSVDVYSVLAAAAERPAVESLLRELADATALAAVLASPAPTVESDTALGLPPRWLQGLRFHDAPGGGDGATGSGAARQPIGKAAGEQGDDGGPATRARGGEGRTTTPPQLAAAAAAAAAADPADSEPLRFFNGYGGFSEDGAEYVIRLTRGPDGRLRLPPLPWANVIANQEAGCLVTERGAGYTWSANSRENRITPWSNDPVADPHGEALYLRDERSGRFWSPTPGPVPGAGDYEVRHGFGYTTFRHASEGLEQEVRCFVVRRDPVRVVWVRLTNRADETRAISVYSYAQLVLGTLPCETRGDVVTERSASGGAIVARNPRRAEFSGRVAFAAAVAAENAAVELTTDRAAFLGGGGVAAPAAVRSGERLDGRIGGGLDACAALRVRLELAPGETAECAFLLGEARDSDFARAALLRHQDLASVEQACADAADHWRELLGGVRIETPAPALDLMVNGWLAYQNLSCRMWGRSAFYQSGGAFGFRDQLQDASALLYLQPAVTRWQLVLHASQQFVEGDVMHWWHPPLGKGIRTRFSDDLLWLPYVAAFYLRSTGDESVLDEPAPFLHGPALEPGEDECFLVPEAATERGTVYEHCCRAIDRSLTRGAHGLPLMGVGDWNDGMNRVGREGRGESVWLGFFLFRVLAEFIPICERREDAARVEAYREYGHRLADALNDAGWDGAWYRRAYYDNGVPLGSAGSDECRIDAIAQAWAVISGAAPPERAELALNSMESHLVSEREGLIRLLTPAFDRTPHDPGYIKGYLPGVRENGGQYTHAALWAVRALAEAGRADRAARLLEMLSPVRRAADADAVAAYMAEPYVIAADVYGVEPHVGRGGWTWYTGSAGWMYRVALESVLGFELRGGRAFALRPCIPDEWPGFRLAYRLPDGRTRYVVELSRAGAGEAATLATLDGEPVAVEEGAVVVPLLRDGAEHRVSVTLAADVGRRYEPRLGAAAV